MSEETQPIQFVPYQLCPKCSGQGTVTLPPYAAGDVQHWISKSTTHQCDVCFGAKIIPQYIIDSQLIKYEKAAPAMYEALKKIIQMSRKQAEDQYGYADKAETWACVRVARAGLFFIRPQVEEDI